MNFRGFATNLSSASLDDSRKTWRRYSAANCSWPSCKRSSSFNTTGHMPRYELQYRVFTRDAAALASLLRAPASTPGGTTTAPSSSPPAAAAGSASRSSVYSMPSCAMGAYSRYRRCATTVSPATASDNGSGRALACGSGLRCLGGAPPASLCITSSNTASAVWLAFTMMRSGSDASAALVIGFCSSVLRRALSIREDMAPPSPSSSPPLALPSLALWRPSTSFSVSGMNRTSTAGSSLGSDTSPAWASGSSSPSTPTEAAAAASASSRARISSPDRAVHVMGSPRRPARRRKVSSSLRSRLITWRGSTSFTFMLKSSSSIFSESYSCLDDGKPSST